MDKKNYPVLAASLITIILLIVIVFIFFFRLNDSKKEDLSLEMEEEKIETKTFDLPLITPKEVFNAINKKEFLILDTRENQDFFENHIESSINIALQEVLKNENLLNKEQTLIFVEKQESSEGKEVADKLKQAGYRLNYLEGGLYGYLEAGYDLISYGDPNSAQDRAKVNFFDLDILAQKLEAGERFIYLDVRKKADFEKDHFKSAVNIPLEDLEKNKRDVPTGKLLIIDEDPVRSFQGAVRLSDMNFLTTYYLSNKYSELRDAVNNETLFK